MDTTEDPSEAQILSPSPLPELVPGNVLKAMRAFGLQPWMGAGRCRCDYCRPPRLDRHVSKEFRLRNSPKAQVKAQTKAGQQGTQFMALHQLPPFLPRLALRETQKLKVVSAFEIQTPNSVDFHFYSSLLAGTAMNLQDFKEFPPLHSLPRVNSQVLSEGDDWVAIDGSSEVQDDGSSKEGPESFVTVDCVDSEEDCGWVLTEEAESDEPGVAHIEKVEKETQRPSDFTTQFLDYKGALLQPPRACPQVTASIDAAAVETQSPQLRQQTASERLAPELPVLTPAGAFDQTRDGILFEDNTKVEEEDADDCAQQGVVLALADRRIYSLGAGKKTRNAGGLYKMMHRKIKRQANVLRSKGKECCFGHVSKQTGDVTALHKGLGPRTFTSTTMDVLEAYGGMPPIGLD
mmetsp:Transcript_33864/g.52740  ORF Transcript_33864/g.52740 Transcript_33864/m.52740 type:complete len:405 (+) Transcript_33864:277-1491(+)